MTGCPHRPHWRCPLYAAAHQAGMPTCMTGDLDRGCAVDRGQRSYDAMLAKLARAGFPIVRPASIDDPPAGRA